MTESRRIRPVQLAFVNAASALPCRPEPRAAFDNAARRDNPSRPWERCADPMRAVAAEAARIGGPCIQQTEERIIDFAIALMEYMLEPLTLPHSGECTYLVVTKEVPEGVEAITTAKLDPTPENIANADVQVGEAARALQLYQGGLRRRASNYPRPMGCSPAPVGLA
jgi:hypothetical protein